VPLHPRLWVACALAIAYRNRSGFVVPPHTSAVRRESSSSGCRPSGATSRRRCRKTWAKPLHRL